MQEQLFDQWPETYDNWFATPIGALVKKFEGELILDLLRPHQGEKILDAGCGTGVFTLDILSSGAFVVGLDLSLPMLIRAGQNLKTAHFQTVLGDMIHLPFRANTFDKVVSVTALEFIQDARKTISELFRVVKGRGSVVVATLNSLSPWAARRKAKARIRSSIFEKAIFRSPDELRSLAPVQGIVKTAIHFQKDETPQKAIQSEIEGQRQSLETGAFVIVRWEKP